MKKLLKSYKTEIKPIPEQIQTINRTIGTPPDIVDKVSVLLALMEILLLLIKGEKFESEQDTQAFTKDLESIGIDEKALNNSSPIELLQIICAEYASVDFAKMKELITNESSISFYVYPNKPEYLDDMRPCPQGFVPAKSYDECVNLLLANDITVISLDHDLGEEKTGYDVAKFMVENNIFPDKIYTHSANPVGVANIYQLLNHYAPSEIEIYKKVY